MPRLRFTVTRDSTAGNPHSIGDAAVCDLWMLSDLVAVSSNVTRDAGTWRSEVPDCGCLQFGSNKRTADNRLLGASSMAWQCGVTETADPIRRVPGFITETEEPEADRT